MSRQAEPAPVVPPRANSPSPDPVLLGGRPLHQDHDRAGAPLDEYVAGAGLSAVQEHLDAAGRPRQHPNEGGGYGEVAQYEASPVEDGPVRVESLHGEDGESRYLADVRVDGGAVSVLRVVHCGEGEAGVGEIQDRASAVSPEGLGQEEADGKPHPGRPCVVRTISRTPSPPAKELLTRDDQVDEREQAAELHGLHFRMKHHGVRYRVHPPEPQ